MAIMDGLGEQIKKTAEQAEAAARKATPTYDPGKLTASPAKTEPELLPIPKEEPGAGKKIDDATESSKSLDYETIANKIIEERRQYLQEQQMLGPLTEADRKELDVLNKPSKHLSEKDISESRISPEDKYWDKNTGEFKPTMPNHQVLINPDAPLIPEKKSPIPENPGEITPIPKAPLKPRDKGVDVEQPPNAPIFRDKGMDVVPIPNAPLFRKPLAQGKDSEIVPVPKAVDTPLEKTVIDGRSADIVKEVVNITAGVIAKIEEMAKRSGLADMEPKEKLAEPPVATKAPREKDRIIGSSAEFVGEFP